MRTDQEIQSDVAAELHTDPSAGATHVGVSVNEGVVTLSGYVSNYAEKWAAERAAKRVYGVKAVADEVTVKIPSASERTDDEIAEAAVQALRWHAAVPDDLIKLVVENGWVTLEGAVDWQYQKDAALQAIRSLLAVRGVIDRVSVAPRVKPAVVRDQIHAALVRNAEVDARRIGVKAKEGHVVLHGNVRSWFEREEAARAAWNIPGVREVENELTVTP